jgi:hypothetical protein
VVPHRRGVTGHAGTILGLGSDLQGPNRHAALEALLEALRHRQGREHPLEQQRQGRRTEQRRDGVAQHVAKHRHGRGRDQQRVGPHGRVVVARQQDQAAHPCRIGKRERQGGKRPPGVADHHRALDVEMRKGAAKKVGLRRGSPRRATWPVAVAVAGAIEGDDAMPLRGYLVEHAAQDPVLRRHHVAVEQHDRCSGTPLEVVQPDAINLDEASGGRMPALDLSGMVAVVERCRSKRCCGRTQDRAGPGPSRSARARLGYGCTDRHHRLLNGEARRSRTGLPLQLLPWGTMLSASWRSWA